MNEDVGKSFVDIIVTRTTSAKARLNHCLNQIDSAVLWSSPKEANSIGIVLQHLNGNLKQWVLSALGGQPDIRQRNKEFVVEGQIPLEDMRASVNTTMDAVISTYQGAAPSRLMEPLVVQGMNHTVMSAMFNTVCHLELHLGQVTLLTKEAIGAKYKEYWKPKTKEQGA